MTMTAEQLRPGDTALFAPNSKGGISGKQEQVYGVVLGRKKSQRPDIPNVLVEVVTDYIPEKRSFGGKTTVTWSSSQLSE